MLAFGGISCFEFLLGLLSSLTWTLLLSAAVFSAYVRFIFDAEIMPLLLAARCYERGEF